MLKDSLGRNRQVLEAYIGSTTTITAGIGTWDTVSFLYDDGVGLWVLEFDLQIRVGNSGGNRTIANMWMHNNQSGKIVPYSVRSVDNRITNDDLIIGAYKKCIVRVETPTTFSLRAMRQQVSGSGAFQIINNHNYATDQTVGCSHFRAIPI